MKDIVPPPPPLVRNDAAAVQELFAKYVAPTYGRFELVLVRGAGNYVWDITGRRYLDLGGGIAVCSLGHANAEITQALVDQSTRLVHVSNLYYHEPQGRLAQALTQLIGPGKVFFSNSGAESNEGLYKLARKFGHEEGRFEILTAVGSFHGRTLAGIAATGQEKIKKGFDPQVAGFRHVPFNDLEAMRRAISPATAAILIESIHGESGITAAQPDYLIGLRRLCDERRLLLLIDEVQAGHFRTGRFHGWQRILENHPEGANFLPDGISMAKSLGGGFPIGAFWIRERHADLLGPGTHATTYGGNPLGCAVALKILEVIHRERLDQNVRKVGEHLQAKLLELARECPQIIRAVRGFGLMIGIELAQGIPAFAKEDKPAAIQFVKALHQAGVLTVPAGAQVVRLLPALNLGLHEADEGLAIIRQVVKSLL